MYSANSRLLVNIYLCSMRWLLLILPFSLFGQSVPKVFSFADGVYLSHAALLANQPDTDWGQVAGEMVQLTGDYRLLIDGFGYKDGVDRRPYAVSLNGRPFFFVRADEKRNYHEFAAPRIWGRYLTVQYDSLQQNRYLMRAYNPTNGLPFRQGYVERENWNRVERLIDLRTGEGTDLDYAAVLAAVDSEQDLKRALQRDPAAGREKLLRALSVYNQRYPMPLPYQSPSD
jgi:hypothetical protein